MQLRRSLALVSGALLLTAFASSCGFDPATNRINNIAGGATDRDASVDVLNAVIVSGEDGSGRLVTTLVNNDLEESATLEALAPVEDGVGNDPDQVTGFPDFSPIEVEPGGLVNLADEEQEPVEVTGDFKAGDVVSVSFTISGGQTLELGLPVVANCPPYEGLVEPESDCEVTEVEEH